MASAVQKSALLLCGDYMEAYETIVPLYVLQSFGVSVHCVSPNRTAGDRCVMSAHDFLGLEVPNFSTTVYEFRFSFCESLNFFFFF